MKKIFAGFIVGVSLIIGALAWAGVGPINSVTRIFAASGTTTAPAYSWIGATNNGIWRSGNNTFFSIAGGARVRINDTTGQFVAVDNGGGYAWTSGAVDSTGADTRIQRIGAGAIQIDNAAGGTGTLQMSGFTFANIATALTVNGQIGFCSDCTIANPCAGAGTGALAKRLNGVNVCN